MNKIISTPLARALAAKLNIAIEAVKGSGPNGRILKADVEAFKNNPQVSKENTSSTSSSSAQVKTVVSTPSLDGRREKVTPMRKAIARAMTTSWEKNAYVSLVNEIDMTNLWNLRKMIVEDVQKSTGVKLTFLPYISKAILYALKEFPIMAAKYDEATEEIVYPATLNLGIAVDTEAGLMVPVVKDAHTLTMVELAQEINRLALAARDRKIKPNEMQGGSFTITNYGSVGALFGVPVINYPEIAIAGVGAIVDRPVVKGGQIVPGKVMNLTVSADHRWIDGATIGRFAARVKELLEKPEILGVL